MGNAAITINHPTMLDHVVLHLEAATVTNDIEGVIRFEMVRDHPTSQLGCGALVQLTRSSVSSWTFRVDKTNTSKLQVGAEIQESASSRSEALRKLSIKYGVSVPEMEESLKLSSVAAMMSATEESNKSSSLYCFASSNHERKGHKRWRRNDLNLQASHRWNDNSEMIIDISFEENAKIGDGGTQQASHHISRTDATEGNQIQGSSLGKRHVELSDEEEESGNRKKKSSSKLSEDS